MMMRHHDTQTLQICIQQKRRRTNYLLVVVANLKRRASTRLGRCARGCGRGLDFFGTIDLGEAQFAVGALTVRPLN